MTALGTIAAEAKACRAAFADSKVGDWAWCLHHGALVEPLTEPAKKRIAYILSKKPERERARRLREFRPVLGPLPEPLVRAWAKYVRARAEYVRARAEYDESMPALEEQHRAEYPDTTWNGRSIFEGEA